MKYLRLLSRLEGACLFISEAKLRVITEKVTIPLYFGEVDEIERLPANSLRSTRQSSTGVSSSSTKVRVIEVFDSLVSKASSAASGMTSYQSISSQIDYALEDNVTHLVFNIDSPGGEAIGLFSLTSKIRKLSEKGIKTIGFTDGMATSAAYAILAACSETYSTETSILGSIASIMVHVDTSVQDKEEGRTYTILRSKPEKALADSHNPLSSEAESKLRNLLDTMDSAFNNDILASRGIPVDNIIALKGSEFMATEAQKLNLVDNIVSGFDDIISLVSQPQSPKTSRGGYMTLEEAEVMIASLEAEKVTLQTSISEISAKLEAATASNDTEAVKTALEAQKTEFVSLLSAAPTLRMDTETVSSILAESPTISSALTTMKHVAKFSSQKISGASGLQSTLGLSQEEIDSKSKVESALAAFYKATGVK